MGGKEAKLGGAFYAGVLAFGGPMLATYFSKFPFGAWLLAFVMLATGIGFAYIASKQLDGLYQIVSVLGLALAGLAGVALGVGTTVPSIAGWSVTLALSGFVALFVSAAAEYSNANLFGVEEYL